MSMEDIVNELAGDLSSEERKKYFNTKQLTIKDENTFRRYAKKISSNKLLTLVEEYKLTSGDFYLLLKQKLTNLLGDDSEYILASDTALEKGYGKFFKTTLPEPAVELAYFKRYKSLKNQIQKQIKQLKKNKIKTIINKSIKQFRHLTLNKSRLKMLAKNDEKKLKTMVDGHKLYVADFKTILRYKLISEYLGEKAFDIYEKHKNILCGELKIFFDKSYTFDKSSNRNKRINEIYEGYIKIIESLSNSKPIIIAGGKQRNIFTLDGYDQFKKQYEESKKKLLELYQKSETAKPKRKKWLEDILFAPHLINNKEIGMKIKERASENLLEKLTRPDFYENLEKDALNCHCFNFFKLIKNDIIKEDELCQPLRDAMSLFNFIAESKQIESISYDKALYITTDVITDIKKLSLKELEKHKKADKKADKRSECIIL